MYIDSKIEGALNKFICDFVQDEKGRFHFLKISDFNTDKKPTFTFDWKISTKIVEEAREIMEKKLATQICRAEIICIHKPSKEYFENSCKENGIWF